MKILETIGRNPLYRGKTNEILSNVSKDNPPSDTERGGGAITLIENPSSSLIERLSTEMLVQPREFLNETLLLHRFPFPLSPLSAGNKVLLARITSSSNPIRAGRRSDGI